MSTFKPGDKVRGKWNGKVATFVRMDGEGVVVSRCGCELEWGTVHDVVAVNRPSRKELKRRIKELETSVAEAEDRARRHAEGESRWRTAAYEREAERDSIAHQRHQALREIEEAKRWLKNAQVPGDTLIERVRFVCDSRKYMLQQLNVKDSEPDVQWRYYTVTSRSVLHLWRSSGDRIEYRRSGAWVRSFAAPPEFPYGDMVECDAEGNPLKPRQPRVYAKDGPEPPEDVTVLRDVDCTYSLKYLVRAGKGWGWSPDARPVVERDAFLWKQAASFSEGDLHEVVADVTDA